MLEANMAHCKRDNQLPQTCNRLYQIAIGRLFSMIKIIDYHDLEMHNKGYLNEIIDYQGLIIDYGSYNCFYYKYSSYYFSCVTLL